MLVYSVMGFIAGAVVVVLVVAIRDYMDAMRELRRALQQRPAPPPPCLRVGTEPHLPPKNARPAPPPRRWTAFGWTQWGEGYPAATVASLEAQEPPRIPHTVTEATRTSRWLRPAQFIDREEH